ncbi:MAG: hypothetical protein ACTS6G_04935 [Candidatus Hodgkinia cicadicola]
MSYAVERGRFLRITHPCAAGALPLREETFAWLACVRPAASVRSEPGSSSLI